MTLQKLRRDLETMRRALQVQDTEHRSVQPLLRKFEELCKSTTIPKEVLDRELSKPVLTLEDAIHRAALRNLCGI